LTTSVQASSAPLTSVPLRPERLSWNFSQLIRGHLPMNFAEKPTGLLSDLATGKYCPERSYT
jgi:hypothetical protein